ncbi:hypothetical protein BTUL_0211g00250 [Botrytis tulipae]|uniref:Uncharacterized protein n=1 Tax=Botrytis tulipae TaxID=87230 RepID=A0A4Z1E898_9HELO|nr:hypothetical protein BTUL_0211g00250 [Botrytis tulipae]
MYLGGIKRRGAPAFFYRVPPAGKMRDFMGLSEQSKKTGKKEEMGKSGVIKHDDFSRVNDSKN